jgi:hypothetical protein
MLLNEQKNMPSHFINGGHKSTRYCSSKLDIRKNRKFNFITSAHTTSTSRISWDFYNLFIL